VYEDLESAQIVLRDPGLLVELEKKLIIYKKRKVEADERLLDGNFLIGYHDAEENR